MAKVDQLFIEIQNKNNEAVKTFIEDNRVDIADNFNRTALLNAALYGNQELVDWLIEKGADINHSDRNGYTALHFAAQEAHTEVLKYLLKHNANPNVQDIHGNTPAVAAIVNWGGGKNFDTLKALVDAKADLTLKNKAGRAAIDIISDKLKSQLGIL